MSRPEDQVSINIFEQINSICKEFRRAWRTGESPGWKIGCHALMSQPIDSVSPICFKRKSDFDRRTPSGRLPTTI